MIKPRRGYYGQYSTDMLIELYFPDCGEGHTCVEVGAANGRRGSNTLYFEFKDWDTILIEPNPEYAKTLWATRIGQVFECACASKRGRDIPFKVFDIGERNIMSSVSSLRPDARLVDSHEHITNDVRTIAVETRTLTDILDEALGDPFEIEFISIDTEGTELDVLKGLDMDRWKVHLFVVENNYNDPDVEDYLSGFGYVKDARWKINDFYIKQP